MRQKRPTFVANKPCDVFIHVHNRTSV